MDGVLRVSGVDGVLRVSDADVRTTDPQHNQGQIQGRRGGGARVLAL